MSLGAEPITEEELADYQERQGLAPPPVGGIPAAPEAPEAIDPSLPVEGPAAPGSAQDFIDQTNAQPLAAPVSGVIPDESAFPPPVPPEAPGMVPVAPALPTDSLAAPNGHAPSAAPPIGSPGDVAVAAAGAEKARKESDAADLAALTAQTQGSPEAVALAQEKADNERLRQADTEEQIRLSNEADAKAQGQIAQAQAAKKNFQFKDYWSDKSTARRIGSAIAVAFGAYGAAMTHSQNYALEILNKDMDDDHRNQVDRLNKLSDDELTARTGLADVRQARIQALTDIGVKAADADRVIAAKAAQIAAVTQDGATKAALEAFAKKRESDSADKLLQTRIGLRNAILKAEQERIKNDEIKARTNLYNAQAGKARAKGAGGGAANLNASVISEAAEQGKTLKDLAAMPEARGMKWTELKGIYDEGQKIAGSNADERKTSLHALDKLPGEFKTDLAEAGVVAGQGGAKGLLPTNRSLQKLLHAVDSDNPLSAKEAFLAFDSAARGGSATQGSIDALTKTLGGTRVQFENWMEGKSSGGLSKDAKARFREAITEAIGTNLSAANDSHDALVQKYYAPDYYPLKQHVEGQMGVFSQFRGADGKPVFQVQRDTAAPGVDRTTGKRLPPSAATPTQPPPAAPAANPHADLARKAIASPMATSAQKANAAAYLKSIGEAP